MKKTLLLFIISVFVLFPACKDDNQAVVEKRAQNNSSNIAKTKVKNEPPKKFEMLTFDVSNLPRSIKFQGILKKGSQWYDYNGKNTLIISEDKKWVSEERGDFTRQTINAYLYVEKVNSEPKLLWKFQDIAENICDPGLGLVSDIQVDDLDGDNIAENAFIYNIIGACDVSPMKYKLIFHSNEKKYTVEGSNSVLNGTSVTINGNFNFDNSFSKAPDAFKASATKLWKASVKDIVLK